MMNKAEKQELATLKESVNTLVKELDKERKASAKLSEIAYQKEAQLKRAQFEESRSLSQQWRQRFTELIFNDYREDAISIFEWEDIAPTPNNIFNSKRLESQVFNFAPVFVFPYEYTLATPDGKGRRERMPFALPFVSAYPGLDCYGEFPIIRPYSPNGLNGANVEMYARSDGNPFPPMEVGKDGVVISDFFEWGQTNCNTSMSIRLAVRTYAELIAEVESAKRVNRNWIKIPLLFRIAAGGKESGARKEVQEIARIVQAIDRGDDAIVSKYLDNLDLERTDAQYYGTELEQAKKDYENDLYNYLGIGHIRNENRVRKITAEFEKTSDQYNIKIIKRLQLRQMALKQLKMIMPEFFGNARIKVNLNGYNDVYDENTPLPEVIE